MSNFPRSQYLLPGFASISDMLIANLSSIALPSAIAYDIAAPRAVNVQFSLVPHEWAMTLTPIPLIFIVLGTFFFFKTQQQKSLKPSRQTLLAILTLSFVLLFPLSIQYYSPEWNALLKATPILKSISTPMRWIVLWLPIICVAAALSIDKISTLKIRPYLVIVSSALVCLFVVLEPREYYEQQDYDPKPIIAAFNHAKQTNFSPEISALGAHVDANKNIVLLGNRNDLITRGISQAFCYNPLFGYRLENFDIQDLQPGSTFKHINGHLNLKNPACYTFPKENACAPGDPFTEKQLTEAQQFTHYQPWHFEKSPLQETASLITESTLLLIGILYPICLVLAWKQKRKTPPSPRSDA